MLKTKYRKVSFSRSCSFKIKWKKILFKTAHIFFPSNFSVLDRNAKFLCPHSDVYLLFPLIAGPCLQETFMVEALGHTSPNCE